MSSFKVWEMTGTYQYFSVATGLFTGQGVKAAKAVKAEWQCSCCGKAKFVGTHANPKPCPCPLKAGFVGFTTAPAS